MTLPHDAPARVCSRLDLALSGGVWKPGNRLLGGMTMTRREGRAPEPNDPNTKAAPPPEGKGGLFVLAQDAPKQPAGSEPTSPRPSPRPPRPHRRDAMLLCTYVDDPVPVLGGGRRRDYNDQARDSPTVRDRRSCRRKEVVIPPSSWSFVLETWRFSTSGNHWSRNPRDRRDIKCPLGNPLVDESVSQ
jgi:hypothetical protein